VSVAQRLQVVREKIERTGRNPDEVTIVAVTKGFPATECLAALDAGLAELGENRVQEALAKMEAVQGARWHLIGHLQTNKARLAAHRFALIHAVDSVRVAEAIARYAPSQPVLVEVNVAREPQKSGVDPDRAVELVKAAGTLLDVRGLMAMGPTHGDPSSAFREVVRLRDVARELTGKPLPVLSMGMSGDFEAALAAGSTMLRLGQALFGPRPT